MNEKQMIEKDNGFIRGHRDIDGVGAVISGDTFGVKGG